MELGRADPGDTNFSLEAVAVVQIWDGGGNERRRHAMKKESLKFCDWFGFGD